MSIIIHRCTRCAHRESQHGSPSCNWGNCPCPTFLPATEPVIAPTFDGVTAAPVETLTEPGTGWNAGSQHREQMCSCDACWALYRSTVA